MKKLIQQEFKQLLHQRTTPVVLLLFLLLAGFNIWNVHHTIVPREKIIPTSKEDFYNQFINNQSFYKLMPDLAKQYDAIVTKKQVYTETNRQVNELFREHRAAIDEALSPYYARLNEPNYLQKYIGIYYDQKIREMDWETEKTVNPTPTFLVHQKLQKELYLARKAQTINPDDLTSPSAQNSLVQAMGLLQTFGIPLMVIFAGTIAIRQHLDDSKNLWRSSQPAWKKILAKVLAYTGTFLLQCLAFLVLTYVLGSLFFGSKGVNYPLLFDGHPTTGSSFPIKWFDPLQTNEKYFNKGQVMNFWPAMGLFALRQLLFTFAVISLLLLVSLVLKAPVVTIGADLFLIALSFVDMGLLNFLNLNLDLFGPDAFRFASVYPYSLTLITLILTTVLLLSLSLFIYSRQGQGIQKNLPAR